MSPANVKVYEQTKNGKTVIKIPLFGDHTGWWISHIVEDLMAERILAETRVQYFNSDYVVVVTSTIDFEKFAAEFKHRADWTFTRCDLPIGEHAAALALVSS